MNSFLQYCFLDTLIKYGLFNPELKAMPMVSSPFDECKIVRKRAKPIIFTALRCAVGTSEGNELTPEKYALIFRQKIITQLISLVIILAIISFFIVDY